MSNEEQNGNFAKPLLCAGRFISTKFNLKTMTKRKEAMQWWNGLSSLRKTQICDTNTELVGSVRRWETLTGSEIEMLYEDE